jgi:MoxR-like ATPase
MSGQVELLRREVAKVIVGKQDVVDKLVVAALTEGAHILFEDMRGLAKSVLAATFSKAVGCQFHRIQFTPDLLPTDITGGHIFNRKTNEFDFRPGPIFTNFLLADEINRASPKTQSALLEAMAEKQVSVEGITHRLEPPFLVLATQNPVEQEGTYPLPEAQLDRFAMKLSMGYPSRAEEGQIMSRRLARRHDSFDTEAVLDRAQVLRMQKVVEDVHVDPGLVDYVAGIVDATRHHPDLAAGASPRGSLALIKLARAHAATRGRRYVLPDDVRDYAVCSLAHRLILTTEARVRGVRREKVVQEILSRQPVPRVRPA